MIPQERVYEAAETANDYMTQGNHRAFNDGFDCGVRFAESELQKPASKSATEYLNSKGRIIEGINGKTGEYVITPEQLDEYAEQFKPKSTISFDRSTLNDMAKKHIENIGFGTGTNITVHALKCCMVDFYLDNQPEMKQTSMEFAEWLAENDWQKTYVDNKKMWHKLLNGLIYTSTTAELFAKFDAERNQHKSEITCPECLSNRILEWPDKYQCRKCEHVWVKLCSCGADHSNEAKYANLCNYCLKPIK